MDDGRAGRIAGEKIRQTGSPFRVQGAMDFTPSNVTATSYTLTAAARSGNDQQNDTYKGVDCSSMSLTQNGVKTPPGCWE